MLCNKTLSPFMVVLAEELGQPRRSPFLQLLACRLAAGTAMGEGKCRGGRSSLGILGSPVERCTAGILQNLHRELSTHGTQAAREGQEEAAPSLCWVRCSDTHGTHSTQSVTMPPPTQWLPWLTAAGTGLIPHHPRGAL